MQAGAKKLLWYTGLPPCATNAGPSGAGTAEAVHEKTAKSGAFSGFFCFALL
jgi:hypothetical protein